MKITVTITQTDGTTIEKSFDRQDISMSWAYMKIQADNVQSVHLQKT